MGHFNTQPLCLAVLNLRKFLFVIIDNECLFKLFKQFLKIFILLKVCVRIFLLQENVFNKNLYDDCFICI